MMVLINFPSMLDTLFLYQADFSQKTNKTPIKPNRARYLKQRICHFLTFLSFFREVSMNASFLQTEKESSLERNYC